MILYTTLHSAVNVSMHLAKSFTIIYLHFIQTDKLHYTDTYKLMLIQVIASLSNIHMVKLKTHPLLFRGDDLNKMSQETCREETRTIRKFMK